jgi:hypothetical protein
MAPSFRSADDFVVGLVSLGDTSDRLRNGCRATGAARRLRTVN